VRNIVFIIEKLAKAQDSFLCAADAIPSGHWTIKPGAQEWSAGEVVAHLVMVERVIVGRADSVTQKAARTIPFLKHMHLPLWLVKTRIVRLKSPIALDPALVGDKKDMLLDLRVTRERTLCFLKETGNGDLCFYSWPHPFLGTLNAYDMNGLK